MRTPALLLFALLALPPSVTAQRLAPRTFASFDESRVESLGLGHGTSGRAASAVEPAPETNVIFGSILAGIGTFWIPAYIASRFHGSPCEDCGLAEALYGAAIGFGAGSALGAHLANHRQGPFGKAALIAMAIGAAGMFAAIETDTAELLLAIPILQVASAVTIERRPRREQAAAPI